MTLLVVAGIVAYITIGFYVGREAATRSFAAFQKASHYPDLQVRRQDQDLLVAAVVGIWLGLMWPLLSIVYGAACALAHYLDRTL